MPSSAAHAAPDPPEWMTRLLHDFNDDWGGDDGQGLTRDGHDIFALDLQEAYNATLGGNVLVFRLSLNFGYNADATKPELKEVLTFKAKGQAVAKEFRTSDNQKFQGTFDAVSGPFPMLKSDGTRDGGRFYVEGALKYDTLGLKVGDKISDFFVQGYAGTQAADHMVGGYTVGAQKVETEPPSEQSSPTSYRRNEYPLQGPVMYLRSEMRPTTLESSPGKNQTITWSITNTLGKEQAFTLTTKAPAGVTVTLHGPKFNQGSFKLAAGLTSTVHAYVTPDESAASGPLEFSVVTNLGGKQDHRVDLTFVGANGETSPTLDASTPLTSADAPAPGFLFFALAAAVVASVRAKREK